MQPRGETGLPGQRSRVRRSALAVPGRCDDQDGRDSAQISCQGPLRGNLPDLPSASRDPSHEARRSAADLDRNRPCTFSEQRLHALLPRFAPAGVARFTRLTGGTLHAHRSRVHPPLRSPVLEHHSPEKACFRGAPRLAPGSRARTRRRSSRNVQPYRPTDVQAYNSTPIDTPRGYRSTGRPGSGRRRPPLLDSLIPGQPPRLGPKRGSTATLQTGCQPARIRATIERPFSS